MKFSIKNKYLLAMFPFLMGAVSKLPPGLTVDEIVQISKEPGTRIIDVRTPEEYVEGHIAGAILLPVTEIKTRSQGLPDDPNCPIIVYCTVGVRSARARNILLNRGFTRVFNLKGGIEAWKAAGKPLTTER